MFSIIVVLHHVRSFRDMAAPKKQKRAALIFRSDFLFGLQLQQKITSLSFTTAAMVEQLNASNIS